MADVAILNINGTSYNIKDTSARSAAAAAQSTADTAKSAAAAAQSTANSAQSAAEAAQTTANNALAGAWNITYATNTETITFEKVEE